MCSRLVRLCAILSFLLFAGEVIGIETLKLIPMPAEIQIDEGRVKLTSDWKICVMENNADDVYAEKLISEEAKICFGFEPEIATKIPENNYILLKDYKLKGDEPDLFREQGYWLTIGGGKIIIESPTVVGRFYGVQTLRQIFRNSRNGEILCLKIRDYPALKWRGISDDISRGQVSMVEDFKEIIKQLAFYKKNIYQPYIEDMFSFEIDLNIGSERGAITKAEMREMVEEARKNHIELCPVFECLGHQDRLLSLSENRRYAEIQDLDKKPWSFSPALPEACEFVEKLIAEIANETKSQFFHIGGDESDDIGKGMSRKIVKKKGVGRVHAEYFSRLYEYIKNKYNREVMVYSDMLLRHPEALEYMPKDIIVIDWHYGPVSKENYSSLRKLKDAGFKNIIASPAIWSWESFYPNYRFAFQNITEFTSAAKKEKALGCITSAWGDNGAENLRENNWTGYALSAAAEWEQGTPELEQFLKCFVNVHYGVDSQDLADMEKNLGWLDYLDLSYPSVTFHKPLKIKSFEKSWLDKMEILEKNMQKILNIIASYRDKVKFNSSHLDTISHCARRYSYMARRDKTIDKIFGILGDKKSGAISSERQKLIISDLEKLRDELIEIKYEYQRLWLRKNKYPKLDFNLKRLEKQVGELQNFITLIKSSELKVFEPTQTVWFWYPDDNPKENASKGTKYFIRVFHLHKEVSFAEIKCWADDRITVFINNVKSAESFYDKPPDIQNVTHLLKRGKNYLAVEGYNGGGAAGIILQLKIVFSDKNTLYITGDNEWLTAEHTKGRWKTSDPDPPKWKPVKLLGEGIIEPWSSIVW